jgi:hypothetical protein
VAVLSRQAAPRSLDPESGSGDAGAAFMPQDVEIGKR